MQQSAAVKSSAQNVASAGVKFEADAVKLAGERAAIAAALAGARARATVAQEKLASHKLAAGAAEGDTAALKSAQDYLKARLQLLVNAWDSSGQSFGDRVSCSGGGVACSGAGSSKGVAPGGADAVSTPDTADLVCAAPSAPPLKHLFSSMLPVVVMATTTYDVLLHVTAPALTRAHALLTAALSSQQSLARRLQQRCAALDARAHRMNERAAQAASARAQLATVEEAYAAEANAVAKALFSAENTILELENAARAKEPQRRSLFEARVQLETRWQALSAEVAQAEAVAAAAVAATAAAATSAKAALAAENDKREAAEAAAAADAAALSGLEAAASAAAAEVAAAAAVEEAAITAAAAAEKRASASAAAAAQLTQLVTDTLAAVVELDTAQAETSGPLERLCTARETLLDAAKRVHRTRIGASATLTAAFAAESLAARISSAATRVRCALPDAIGALAAAVEEAEGAGSRYAAAAADVSSLSDALSDGVWQPALASVFHAASPGLRLCVSTASAAAAAGTALRSWAARARPWPAAAAAALREIEAPTLLPLAASSGSAATAVRAGTTVENAASVTGAIRSRRRNVTAASAASVTPTSTAVSITANVASLPRSVASSTGPLRGLLLQLTTLVSDVEVAMGRGRTADRVASGADGSPGEAAAAAVAKLAVDVDAHAALGVARRGALEAEAAAAAAHAEALRVVERQIRDSLARHEADVKEAASAAASARTVVTVAKAATKATSKDANGADVAKVGVVASAKAATASVTATNVLVTATPASQKKLQRDHAAKLTSLVSASATTAVAPQPPVDVIASSTSSAAQASVWRLVKLTPPEADDDDDNGNDGTAGSHKHETLNVPQPSAALPAKAPMDNVASTTSIASLSASARKLGGRGNVSFASAADGDGLSLDRVPPRPPQVMSAPAAKQARRSMSHASHSGGGSGGDISGSSGSSGRRLGSYGVVEQVSRKSLNGNNDDDWHFDAPPPRRARFSDGADTNLLGGSFGSYFRRGSSVGAGDGTLLATQRTPASTATSAAAPASAATLTAGSFRSDPAASPYDFSSDEAASGHGRASERAFGHHLPATATSARPGALTLTTVRPRVPRPAAGGAAASASRSHVSPKPAPRHGPGANDSPGSVVSMDLFSQCGLPTR